MGNLQRKNEARDNRSGKFAETRNSLSNFFSQMQFVESHYTREKRLKHYLPSDCNVRKLSKEYNQAVSQEKKVIFFYTSSILITSCIRFKTDACSTCVSLRSKISVMQPSRAKTELIA